MSTKSDFFQCDVNTRNSEISFVQRVPHTLCEIWRTSSAGWGVISALSQALRWSGYVYICVTFSDVFPSNRPQRVERRFKKQVLQGKTPLRKTPVGGIFTRSLCKRSLYKICKISMKDLCNIDVNFYTRSLPKTLIQDLTKRSPCVESL